MSEPIIYSIVDDRDRTDVNNDLDDPNPERKVTYDNDSGRYGHVSDVNKTIYHAESHTPKQVRDILSKFRTTPIRLFRSRAAGGPVRARFNNINEIREYLRIVPQPGTNTSRRGADPTRPNTDTKPTFPTSRRDIATDYNTNYKTSVRTEMTSAFGRFGYYPSIPWDEDLIPIYISGVDIFPLPAPDDRLRTVIGTDTHLPYAIEIEGYKQPGRPPVHGYRVILRRLITSGIESLVIDGTGPEFDGLRFDWQEEQIDPFAVMLGGDVL